MPHPLDHGYELLDKHLSRASVEKLLDVLALDSVGNFLRVKRGAAFAGRNLLVSPAVREFLKAGVVRELVDRYGPGAVPVRAIFFDKTGDANWSVPWHQDRSIAVREKLDAPGYGPWSTKAGVVHVQPPVDVLRSMFTLRFSLDACDASNGPLRVIADTHRDVLRPDEIESLVATAPQITCMTHAGGVVVIRPLVLHASSPAAVATHRRVLHIEYGLPTLPGGVTWAWAA